MRALRKGQTRSWQIQGGVQGEVRLIERAFGLGQPILAELVQHLEQQFALHPL